MRIFGGGGFLFSSFSSVEALMGWSYFVGGPLWSSLQVATHSPNWPAQGQAAFFYAGQ